MVASRISSAEEEYRVLLLGAPALWRGDQGLALRRRQVRALLYYLGHETGPAPRERLAHLFWAERPEAAARRNLTRLLSAARAELEDGDLLVSRQGRVALDWERVWSDCVAFDRLAEGRERERLEEAEGLYRGRFLEGFSLPDSPAYGRWQDEMARACERRYLALLLRLVEVCEGEGDLAAAIGYARDYLAVDELAEEVHRKLVELYAADGDRSAAARQFEMCTLVLERELGVRPLPETRVAYEAALAERPARAPVAPTWSVLPSLDLPLTGREEAWEQLDEAHGRLQAGGLILISGEPGVGKSRLMQAFATDSASFVLAGNNPRGAQKMAYTAIAEALRQALARPERWRGIRPIWLAEVGRLLPEMGDIFADLPAPVEVEASQAQARLFEGMSRCLLGLAGQGPLLLCLDDVHCADAGTMGWLTALAPRLAGGGVCILATYRSAHAAALADVKRAFARPGLLAEVPLSRLTEAAVEDILEALPEPPPEPQPLAKRIHHATGGNTFFVLETVRALMEVERLADPPEDVPLAPTVEAAIRRRLDRLNPLGRQVLEAAAVLGTDLRARLLQETAGRSGLEVAEGLDEVMGRQLLVDGETRGFSHDLVRQVTYEEISPWRRRILHGRAAEGLEKIYHAASISSHDVISGRIAAHYEQGSRPGNALAYYRRAAAAALRVFASAEAHDYTVKGLDMLEMVTDKSEYASQELELQLLLGAILLDTERLFDPQIEVAFGRAAELSELLHQPLKQARALQGLCYFNINRGGLERAQTYSERLLDLGRTLDNKEILVDGHWNLGSIFQFKGQFTEARKHLKIASRHYRHEDLKNAKIYGQPADMACLAYLAQTLQFLGYPNRALEQLHTATILAHQKAHPNYRGLALIFTAQVYQQRGNHAVTREAADELLSIIDEFRVPLFYAIGTLYRGWALFAQGEREEGLDQLGEAVRMIPQSPPIPATPMYLSLMVEAYTQAGQLKRAAGILDQALAVVEKSGLHFWEAELCRLRAELRWRQGERAATVEHSFLRAVQVAEQQHAKWLELRAVMSLARWWQSQGRREEARQKLAEIYEWFTEGFDTVYLKTAEALLEELA